MNASTFGLIVIVFEKYFKIVHPIKHRNNFRPWMVKLGVVAPWIDGFFVFILPNWLTSDVVDGVCLMAFAKPFASELYRTLIFVWHDIIPLLIFIFCHSKIFQVVRRQNRIFSVTRKENNVITGSSGGCAEIGVNAANDVPMRTTGKASAKGDGGQEQMSHREKKIILTMLAACACFVVFWFPLDLFVIFSGHLPHDVVSTVGTALTVLAYTAVLLGAIINSIRTSVITRSWRAFRHLCDAILDNKLQ